MKKILLATLVLILIILTSGCYQIIVAPSYAPDYSVLDSLRQQKLSKIAVESVEPKDTSERVNNITLRTIPLASSSGSYAKYLEEAIKSDLFQTNLLDQNSLFKLVIYLLNNDIDIRDFSKGYGIIEANFKINRNGTIIFDKKIAAKTEFESSFNGGVAIPKGQYEYPNLVRALLNNLYTDKDFIHVLQN